jgi:AcrR family transcriptional regulator
MKRRERDEARTLRRDHGMSIGEIARAIGVSRSSVSVWVRDVELSAAQRESLRARNPALNGQLAGVRARAAKERTARLVAQEQGRRLARRREALHAAGCMLFWAEGSRHRNTVRFTNSDPAMVAFFAAFLRRYFDPPERSMRVACNLFADHVNRQRAVEDFWLGVIGLPRSCLTRSTVNVHSPDSGRTRLNVLPWGTCRLTLHSTAVVQHLYGAIQEYGGFERPEWLDRPEGVHRPTRPSGNHPAAALSSPG